MRIVFSFNHISIHKALTGLDDNRLTNLEYEVISIHKALTGLDQNPSNE